MTIPSLVDPGKSDHSHELGGDAGQPAGGMPTMVPLELLLLAIGVALVLMVAAGAWGWRESVRQVSMGLALSFAGAAPLVALLAAVQRDAQLLLAVGRLLLLSRVFAEASEGPGEDARAAVLAGRPDAPHAPVLRSSLASRAHPRSRRRARRSPTRAGGCRAGGPSCGWRRLRGLATG